MIGILVIAHGTVAQSLVECADHIFGARPPKLEAVNIGAQDDPTELLARANALIAQLDDGQGVLVLSDVFGATPCNVACRLLRPGRVEGVSGVNVPMLLKALSHRHEPLTRLVASAMAGGTVGIQPLCAPTGQNVAARH